MSRNRRRQAMESAGSVYIGSLPRGVRVREFKDEVRDRHVNPLHFVWRGYNGFAILVFRTLEEAERALEALHGLQVIVVNLITVFFVSKLTTSFMIVVVTVE